MRHVSIFLAREAVYNRRVVDDRVFRALADPTRRLLLDRLFEREAGL